MGRRNRGRNKHEQWFRGKCSCGRLLRFRFRRTADGERWALFAYDAQLGTWAIIENRACPSCGRSSADMESDEVKEAFADAMAR